MNKPSQGYDAIAESLVFCDQYFNANTSSPQTNSPIVESSPKAEFDSSYQYAETKVLLGLFTEYYRRERVPPSLAVFVSSPNNWGQMKHLQGRWGSETFNRVAWLLANWRDLVSDKTPTGVYNPPTYPSVGWILANSMDLLTFLELRKPVIDARKARERLKAAQLGTQPS